MAILSVGLDRFEPINGSMGHAAGDCLLVETAARLRSVAPGGPHGAVARTGGDEFALLVENPAGPAAVAETAECILAAMRRPFLLESRQMFCW